MRSLDIRRKLKQKQNIAEQSSNDLLDLRPAALQEIERPAFQLPEMIVAPVGAVEKQKFSFSKSIVLVPFTIVVLVFGAFLGARFISFAHSISLSHDSAYSQFSNGIGALLGDKIPALKDLDQSAVASAIRGQRTINVLLLGYGGDGHDGAYLTDSIMDLNIDFATNKVSLISVPRDIWIKIPSNGNDGSYWKINAAYGLGLDQTDYPNKLAEFSGPSGAGNLAKYIISEVIGQPIDYFIAIDFNGFEKIVDTLGGVNINVDSAFTDNSYPTSDALADGDWCVANDNDPNTTCRYKQVHFDAGPQYMDGARALEYVRSRHAEGTEGSDFARSKRQQKLIAAIQQKAMSLGMLPKYLQLMGDIQGHFQTDLSLAEAKDLSQYLGRIDFSLANRLSVNDNDLLVAGKSSDGQYILTPQAGPDDWSAVHSYIYAQLNGINDSAYNEPAQNQN